jgi:hypothetical protein
MISVAVFSVVQSAGDDMADRQLRKVPAQIVSFERAKLER